MQSDKNKLALSEQTAKSIAPSANQDRLSELALADLLDPAFEEAYDRLTRLASRLLHVPVALVSVPTEGRMFFKSFVGLEKPWDTLRMSPATPNYCQHVRATGEILEIADATIDDRLKNDPVTLQMGLVAYLGIPMTIPGGQTLGSFCVIDTKQHKWSANDVAILSDLAQSAITEIQLRAALKQAEWAKAQAEDASRRVTTILEQILDDGPTRQRHKTTKV